MAASPPVKRWYALDNSAKIYTGSMSRSWASLYRVSVTLTEPIRPELLQTALEQTLRRIPSFALALRRGFFWYYLEENHKTPHVEPDVNNPCKRIIRRENDDFLFRVRYYRCRIAVEVFHSLADGSGAMVFLKTLTARYLELLGHPVEATDGVLDCSEPPHPEETEDSLRRYARFDHVESRRESAGYRPRFRREPAPTLHITTGILPVAAVTTAARQYGVSVTEFLAGNLCYAFYRQQCAEHPRRPKAVKLNIPVNMRGFYPSRTLRNFSLFVNPGIDPRYGSYTLEETILQIHHFLRLNIREKKLNAIMSANVGSEKNPLVRLMPLIVKDVALNFSYWMYGESRYSCSMSNLGRVTVPEGMRPFVRRFDFMIGPQRYLLHAATVISYGDRLYFTVTRTAREADVERYLFTGLVEQGIPVEVESNQGG